MTVANSRFQWKYLSHRSRKLLSRKLYSHGRNSFEFPGSKNISGVPQRRRDDEPDGVLDEIAGISKDHAGSRTEIMITIKKERN